MQDLVDRDDIDTLRLDVCDAASIGGAKEAVQAMTGGELSILVNCAGGAYIARPAIELGDPEDLALFDLNFHAAVRMVTAFAPLLLAAGAGAKIVNISSVAGSVPVPYLGMYGAAKSALNSYGETLRVELSPFGIDVVTVVTGVVSNSKDMTAFPLKLSPSSPYKPLEETFYKVFVEANSKPVHGSVYARKVVDQALSRRPRAVWWTGGQALLGWFLTTFVPRFIVVSPFPPHVFILVRMWGLHRLARARRRRGKED
ncbi:hypothetical protein K488DRAFT_85658 [Vararia minispora EC-137]|uniref:Uncharacterized protein n=1 Tax=Vararia minispora EC-137 TaxID=1314806 RepID=A0ACB8QLQ9_9AGAM|nr:hypothetical protein K488DRAFT_85658 [Vararia minispora EC-137]